MSLVTMINGKTEECLKLQKALKIIKPLKEEFYTLSGNKAFDKKSYRTLEYDNRIDRKISCIIGTAFDYMARFIILKYTKSSFNDVFENFIYYRTIIYLKEEVSIEELKKIENLEDNINKSIKEYSLNSEDLMPDRDMIIQVCKMARLELYRRSGFIMTDNFIENLLGEEEGFVIEDLSKLGHDFINKFISSDLIRTDSIVIYNPTFGAQSIKVGGADADIYIDGVLYDFKTTKNPGYASKEAMQIIGYYLLDYVCKLKNNTFECSLIGYDIEKVAFYKARFGEIEIFDINNIHKNKLDEAVEIYNSL
ncbi:MAG: hypothetical protein E7D79_09830 [Clostridium perfringens]|uniref:5-methylcytosine-specific restriction enzyme subunit McrC n=1 Tax=Clostridium perfringens TaxID=1502 RepID=A0AAW4ITJ3_CLOPF|nr:hypothetical protein [Clostridium perfringens]EHP50499.1 hypothetical protein HMPREF9476_00451 [Clostridium perfringens WAL-14572]MBO3354305.1 hypothetical protein [Clostridium perfringens]MBO3357575.1 hypothetical protein [Clostridium perfringens]MDU2319451.1 hypothetical protein [Clostridium perfringens]MDU7981266.1 hypothetical protein [Clostridium perfringens]